MAEYNKTTDFGVKDSLSASDPAKIIKGAELDDEFDNIETALDSALKDEDIASQAEARAATDDTKVMTPQKVADIFDNDTNTFSPGGYTGFSANPDMQFNYIKIGNLVIVHENGSTNRTGTSNNATVTLTGWPAAIRPATNPVPTTLFPFINNSNRFTCQFVINTDGTVDIRLHNDANDRLVTGVFDNGTCGLIQNALFFYTLDDA